MQATMPERAGGASPVKAAPASPGTPTEASNPVARHDDPEVGEVETEQSPVGAAQVVLAVDKQPAKVGSKASVESDRARTDSDDDDEEEAVTPQAQPAQPNASPKRPAPLELTQHDIDSERSDSHGDVRSDEEEEGADLGTPLGYGGGAFGEGEDDFASHRFLGPSVSGDPYSVRGLHGIRRVHIHDKPPRFVSEVTGANGSGTSNSSSDSSSRKSSAASGTHAGDGGTGTMTGLRSQSEADFVEHPLNTYCVTFSEANLGIDTNVVVSLENELLVEVWSVEKDSPAQRAGVMAGDYLVSVNGQHIEGHMTKEQVTAMIQAASNPRTLVFQRDVLDKEATPQQQSKSLGFLEGKKHSKPLMGRLSSAVSYGSSIIGSKWKRKKPLVHPNSFCDGCGMDPIVGALWTCSVCSNYNLCGECYDLGTHGMENSEQMQALSEAIVQFKLQKKCKQFTPEFLLSLRRDICKGRPDKFEYMGGWIADLVGGTAASKITVRGIEIPSLPPAARQRFVSKLMPLVSNRTDIEVNIEWLPDDAENIERQSVDRISAGAASSEEEDGGAGSGSENLEKLRIWISDKKTRTTSPFA